jgi:hypothetical protein
MYKEQERIPNSPIAQIIQRARTGLRNLLNGSESLSFSIEGLGKDEVAKLFRNDAFLDLIRKGGLKFLPTLRDYPRDQQRELLSCAFGPEGANFPHGEELGVFLAEVNNIRWFSPEEKPDEKFLQQMVDKNLKALNRETLPIRLIVSDFKAAMKARKANDSVSLIPWQVNSYPESENRAWGAVLIATRGAGAKTDLAREVVWQEAMCGREALFDAIKTLPTSVTRSVILSSTVVTARCAAWILVQELMPQRGYKDGNPFAQLIEIYKIGCWPIGVVRGEFVIFIPPTQKAV